MDHDLNRLATLDPARGREPTAAEWARSRARLAEAMASERRARRPRRLVLALAAAVGVVLVVPAMLPDDSAAQSWTPVPMGLSVPDAASAADECARSWDRGGTAGEVVLAERRGVTTLLLMWLREGPLISCSSLGSGKLGGAMLLADGPGREPPLPPPGRIDLAGGMGATGSGRDTYSEVAGRIGAGVTGVDIVLPGGETVRASARQGWWAAWWPGPEAGEVDTIRIRVHTADGTREYRQAQLY